jgi:hypothetical protein
MKHPRQGIKSTTLKENKEGTTPPVQAPLPVPIQQYAVPRLIPIEALANPQYTPGPTLINNDHDKAIANLSPRSHGSGAAAV